MSSPGQAERAWEELLLDHSVEERVKQLLLTEYPPGDDLHQVFVQHSWAVTQDSVALALEHEADVKFVREAAWLHDIGIKFTHAPSIHCLGELPYLQHGIVGRELCERVGLARHGLVCERHVGTGLTATEIVEQGLPLPARDMLCVSKEERLICYADQFYSKSESQKLPLDLVMARIKRHGEPALARFLALHQEFGPGS